MIRLAFITPTKYLNDFAVYSDMHLLLAHLVKKNNAYTKFYAERNEIKILDNGLFENKVACSADEILEKAELVDTDVLVAPDVLYKQQETYEETLKFLEKLARLGSKYEVMAVPQADNPDDYIKSLTELQSLEGISWIGLSKLSVPASFKEVVSDASVIKTRLYLTSLMKREKLFNDTINYHLLGLDFVRELEYQKKYRHIFSNDSSAAVWQGVQGIAFERSSPLGAQGYISEKVDFDTDQELTSIKKARIVHNIYVEKEFAS